MQQIERVGVVALLFLIVTIVVVAFWDDGQQAESNRMAERDARRGRSDLEELVRGDERTLRDDGRVPVRRNRSRLSAPIGGDDAAPNFRTAENDPNRADRVSRTADARTARLEGVGTESIQGETSLQVNPNIQLSHNRGREEQNLASGSQRVSVPERGQQPGIAVEPERVSRKDKPTAGAPVEATVGGTWTVRSGETLERIARRALGEGSRWHEIALMNGLEAPFTIRIGQELRLPGSAVQPVESRAVVRAAERPATPRQVAPPAGGEYVVQKGDVLSVIAQRRLGSAKRWNEIVALNPGLDPNRLSVGARLVMPATAVAQQNAGGQKLVASVNRSAYQVD